MVSLRHHTACHTIGNNTWHCSTLGLSQGGIFGFNKRVLIGKEISFRADTVCVRLCSSPQGPDWKFCTKCGHFGLRKNGSNDFYDTWYQPSLGWGLQFGGVGHPVKTTVWPLEGPQKYQLLNRWTDFNEIFQIFRKKYNKNKNFKKVTLTPFLSPWWHHNPLKLAYFSVFVQFQPHYSSCLAKTFGDL